MFWWTDGYCRYLQPQLVCNLCLTILSHGTVLKVARQIRGRVYLGTVVTYLSVDSVAKPLSTGTGVPDGS